MTIYAVGAVYDGDDVSADFINTGIACIGWDQQDAPYAHQMLRRITVGDIIAIKSYAPRQGLYIKAVGIVTRPHYLAGHHPTLGARVDVDWVWPAGPEGAYHVGVMGDKADYIRRGTLYEELNPELQKLFVDLLRGREPEPMGSPAVLEEAE